MVKIVCIHGLNDFSGSPNILAQVIDVFLKNSIPVDLYTTSSNGFLSKHNKETYLFKRSNIKILTLFNYLIAQVILFFKLLKYKDEDVIFYINTIMPFGAALAGIFMKKNVIYHIHETSITPTLLKNFLLCIVKYSSTEVIFVSNYLKDKINIKDITTSVVYNTLPQSFFTKAATSEYIYNNNFTVLMVSSLKVYKGILDLVEIAKLCKNSDIFFKLVVSANNHEISNFFKNISIPTNMKVYACQEDLHEFYKNASIVLSLSRIDQWIETFGMTILEAMSYGIPCIVPPIGGPKELIDDGISGFQINSYNHEEILNAILLLKNDRDVLLSFSKAARNKSMLFSNTIFEKKLLSVVNRFIQKSRLLNEI